MALVAAILVVAAQTLVAEGAVGIGIGGLLAVVAAELEGVVLGQPAADQVVHRGDARCDVFVAGLAAGDAHPVRGLAGVLVADRAALHGRDADVLGRARRRYVGVAHIAIDRLALGIGFVVAVGEDEIAGDEDAPAHQLDIAFGMTVLAISHGRRVARFILVLVAARALLVTGQNGIAGLLVATVAVLAIDVETDGAIHGGLVQVRAMAELRRQHLAETALGVLVHVGLALVHGIDHRVTIPAELARRLVELFFVALVARRVLV